MGLLSNPATREATATPATPVLSNLINLIQDAIIAIRNGTAPLYADVRITIPSSAGYAIVDGQHPTFSGTAPGGTTDWVTTATGAGKVLAYPISVPVGLKIKSFSLQCEKASAGAVTLNARLYKRTGAGLAAVSTALGAGASNNANAPGQIALAEVLAAAETVVAATAYELHIQSSHNVAGDFFGTLDLVYGV